MTHANWKNLQKVLTTPEEGLLDVKESDGAEPVSDARHDLRRGVHQLQQVGSEALDRIARGDWSATQVEEMIAGLEAELVASDDLLAKSGAFPTEVLQEDWRESTELLVRSFDSALAHLESGQDGDLEESRLELENALRLRLQVSDELEKLTQLDR